MPAVVGRLGREAGKSPLLTGCWHDYRAPLVHDLRTLGVSLWQPVSYAEAELLVSEVLASPKSHLTRAVAAAPDPVDPEQAEAVRDTLDDYRRRYGFS